MDKLCPKCGSELYTKKFTLQIRMKANAPGPQRIQNVTYFFKCPVCDYTSPLRNTLEELIDEVL